VSGRLSAALRVARAMPAFALLLALASSASALTTRTVTQTATAGPLRASFSFTANAPRTVFSHESLMIRDGGTVQYRGAVTAPICPTACQPGDPQGSSLRWTHLSAGGPPQLLLNLYAGGAHCCTVGEVFSWAPRARRWVRSTHDFGDPGFRLVHLGGNSTWEFLSADDRFAYAFTDFAASGLPLQILGWSGGRFRNVTHAYPALIARDAADWMRAFQQQRRSHYADTTGVIAAWAADEDSLGHSPQVARFLARAAAAHELNSGLSGEPHNQRYVDALNRFLLRTGYLR
jgi:hypothetical protein